MPNPTMPAQVQKSRRAALSLFAGLPVLASLPAAAMMARTGAPGPDDRLIDLGKQLEAARIIENKAFEVELTDEEANEAMRPSRDIVDQIEAIPARTLDGLKVKARAVDYCRTGDDFEWDGMATDMWIIRSILHSIAAI
jgi:hypothetical protein